MLGGNNKNHPSGIEIYGSLRVSEFTTTGKRGRIYES
jgi:hypothetical protein